MDEASLSSSVRSSECLKDDEDELVIAISNVEPAGGNADMMWF